MKRLTCITVSTNQIAEVLQPRGVKSVHG